MGEISNSERFWKSFEFLDALDSLGLGLVRQSVSIVSHSLTFKGFFLNFFKKWAKWADKADKADWAEWRPDF